MIKRLLDSEIFWKLTVLFLLVFVLLSAFSPFLVDQSSEWIYFNRKWLATICHTSQERAVFFGESFSILCSRCLGIYSVLLIGLLGSFVLRFPAKWKRFLKFFILFSILANAIDVIGDFTQIWSNNSISRLILGSLFGLSISMVFYNKKGKKYVY